MFARGALIVLSLIMVATSTGSANQAKTGVTIIFGATLIDCTGKPPLADSVVIVEGDSIRSVGRRGTAPIPLGARIIDASGKYLVPGLIDMHVHYREWQGELFLANGITTVKDLGNPVEWISELSRMQAEGKLRGPRIFYVGNNLDAPPPEGDHNVGIADARDAERAVRLLRGFGVVAVKVRHKITPELLVEVTRAAHSMGLPVTGHLARTNATEAAVAGIDGLEHATGVARAACETPDQIKTDAKGIQAFLEDLRGFTLMSEKKETALIRLLVEKGVRLIPTMAVRQRAILEDNRQVVAEDGAYAREPELTYVPESVRKDWSEATIDKKIRETFGPDQMRLMREGYRRLERFVRNFREAGGVVLAGSDNLNGIAGLSLRRELESLVAAGLTPMQSLIAATRDAAQFLHQADLGTIEPGKKADLVILNANPLSDIKNLRRIDVVFQNGREVNIGYDRNYALPPSRPELVRPIYFERLLSGKRE